MRGILNIFSYLLSRLVAFRLGNSTLAAAFFLVLIAPATASLLAFADGPARRSRKRGVSAADNKYLARGHGATCGARVRA